MKYLYKLFLMKKSKQAEVVNRAFLCLSHFCDLWTFIIFFYQMYYTQSNNHENLYYKTTWLLIPSYIQTNSYGHPKWAVYFNKRQNKKKRKEEMH